MAALGRWTTTDPILDEQGATALLEQDRRLLTMSAYNYSFNNPVLLVDPDGRMPHGCPPCPGATNAEIRANFIRDGDVSWPGPEETKKIHSAFVQEISRGASGAGLVADAATIGLAVGTFVFPAAAPATVPAMANLQAVARSADAAAVSTAALSEFAFDGESGQTLRAFGAAASGEVLGQASRVAASKKILQHVPEGVGSTFRWASGRVASDGTKVGGQWAPNYVGHSVHQGAEAIGMPVQLMLFLQQAERNE
jgi:hypothetical protein